MKSEEEFVTEEVVKNDSRKRMKLETFDLNGNFALEV